MIRRLSLNALVLIASLLVVLALAPIAAAQRPPVSPVDPEPERKVQTITILTMTPEYSRDRYEAAYLVQEALALLGVDSVVRPMDQAVILNRVRSEPFDFDAYFMAWGNAPERIDPQLFTYSMFHSSEVKHLGNNRQGYISEEYDRIAELARQSLDPEVRRQYVFQLQELVARDVPVLPLYYEDEWNAYNKERLEGVVVQGGIGIWNYHTFVNVRVKYGENVVRIAHRQDNDVLNPVYASIFTDTQILSLIYDYLVRLGPDNEPVPSAAESWTVVDDVTVDVRLKPGQQWHDGRPVTVEDVKFTFDYGLKHTFGKNDTYIRPVKEVQILDENTVRFILHEPTGFFITGTLTAIPILPKHIWENVDDPLNWNNPHPIGSGPFKFTYWRRGEEIRLDRHAAYHTPANIEAIIQVPFANPDAIIGALELKQVDMINPSLTPQQIELARRIPHVEVTRTPGVGWNYFSYNHRRKPFSDLAFRQAMAHVIDPVLIADIVTAGTKTPAGAGHIVSPAAAYWYNPDVPQYEISLERAYQILKEAGYEWDRNGKLYYPKEQ